MFLVVVMFLLFLLSLGRVLSGRHRGSKHRHTQRERQTQSEHQSQKLLHIGCNLHRIKIRQGLEHVGGQSRWAWSPLKLRGLRGLAIRLACRVEG